MKPITEQRRQELISHGNELKERIEHFGHKSDFESKTLQLVEIALASLNSEPFAWIHPYMLDSMDGGRDWGRIWNSPVDEVSEEKRLPVYTAPPVPVIKFPEINLRIAGYRHATSAPTKEWAFMDGAKWMASETKRLNGLGE